jgi:hypothetical protein
MSDADELARRYLALWADYLTALVADPQAAEMLQRWIALTGQFAKQPAAAGERAAASPFPAWPPAGFGFPVAGPASVAAPVAGASGERDAAMDELARRVGELERRLAAVEGRPGPHRTRKGNRASGP